MKKPTLNFTGFETLEEARDKFIDIMEYWGFDPATYTTWGDLRADLNLIGKANTEFLFYEVNGGMIDAIVRADTYDDWISAAVDAYLLFEEYDEANNIYYRPGNGVNISEIGSIVIVPAEYDANNEIITEAVMDDRYHVNIRLAGYALERVNEETGNLQWKDTVELWSMMGEDDLNSNKNEFGKKLYNVTLIQPSSISTKKRIFL